MAVKLYVERFSVLLFDPEGQLGFAGSPKPEIQKGNFLTARPFTRTMRSFGNSSNSSAILSGVISVMITPGAAKLSYGWFYGKFVHSEN